jgi:hypothetical protein
MLWKHHPNMGRKLRFRRFLRRKDSMDSDRLSVQTLPAIIEREESISDRLPSRRTSMSVLCLMRDGSINTVKQLVKLFEMKTVPVSDTSHNSTFILLFCLNVMFLKTLQDSIQSH